MSSFQQIDRHLSHHSLPYRHGFLFLDFDGTLSPLVRRPHLAVMSTRVRRELQELLQNPQWTVIVVSGRDLKTLKQKVRLKKLWLAGNHGFEIQFPNGHKWIPPGAKRALPIVQALARELQAKLNSVRGALLENKTFTLSLHTRTLNPKAKKKARAIFSSVVKKAVLKKDIMIMEGKEVLEVRPRLKWNKGEAVRFVAKKMKQKGVPVYVGDDQTDEDAFKAIRKVGLGIRIGTSGGTHAAVTLKSVRQMPRLLRQLNSSNYFLR